MRAIEKYYTLADVALLLCLHVKTVTERMKAGELGADVVNLGSSSAPDWRIPASGINGYLEGRRLFTEPGIAARTVGELRRKAEAKGQ